MRYGSTKGFNSSYQKTIWYPRGSYWYVCPKCGVKVFVKPGKVDDHFTKYHLKEVR